MKIKLVLASLSLLGSVQAADQKLREIGLPFTNASCKLVWEAPTNILPSALWVYRVLPSNFSPGVVSNLMALGPFSSSNKVSSFASHYPPNPRSLFYLAGRDNSLTIDPNLGLIEYRNNLADNTSVIEGVPNEMEARSLGTNYLRKLGIDPASVGKTVRVAAGTGYIFKHEPSYQVITNTHSRSVSFARALQGVEFYAYDEGCHIQFGHHAGVVELQLSWRNLERDRLCPLAKPETLMKSIREEKCFWQLWSPDAEALGTSIFKKMTIKSVTPYYYGGDKKDSQNWVYPFAYIEASVDMAVTNTIIPEGEVNFKPSEMSSVFKTVVRNITNQTVFLCCPILDDKR